MYGHLIGVVAQPKFAGLVVMFFPSAARKGFFDTFMRSFCVEPRLLYLVAMS